MIGPCHLSRKALTRVRISAGAFVYSEHKFINLIVVTKFMTHLGELVKKEFEKRNCGYGYNPGTESYTPWYRISKFKVKYQNEIKEKDSWGFIKGRTINIKRRIPLKAAATLYHEMQHANLLPLDVTSVIAIQQLFFWYFFNELGNNLTSFNASMLASLTIAEMFHKYVSYNLNEFYANYKTSRKFGDID